PLARLWKRSASPTATRRLRAGGPLGAPKGDGERSAALFLAASDSIRKGWAGRVSDAAVLRLADKIRPAVLAARVARTAPG
ncbi:hypothetical protein L6232_26375, partial [Shewanella sp. C31]|nr:hypothetical protein [Shewanella electrica]